MKTEQIVGAIGLVVLGVVAVILVLAGISWAANAAMDGPVKQVDTADWTMIVIGAVIGWSLSRDSNVSLKYNESGTALAHC